MLATGRYYGAFAGNIPFGMGDFFLESSQDNITANAGGGWAPAYQINSQTSRITTVATAGDSIQLPPSAPGLEVLVINHGANYMQVYGNNVEAATIDDQTGSTGVSHMANSMVIYTCATAGKWYSEGLSTGFSPALGMQTLSNAAVTASSGGAQGGGPISALVNMVSAGASGYSVTLPVSVPGLCITIHCITASNTVKVYPNAGGTTTEAINALGANAAITMAATTSAQFCCQTAGQWYTIPRVPS